jgi:hypothetical protein
MPEKMPESPTPQFHIYQDAKKDQRTGREGMRAQWLEDDIGEKIRVGSTVSYIQVSCGRSSDRSNTLHGSCVEEDNDTGRD